MTARAVTVLLRAAAYLEQHGWSQGSAQPRRPGPPCCLMIALGFASDEIRDGFAASAAFYEAKGVLQRYVRPPGGLLSTWNDAPGRTADEVIAALRGAAEGHTTP